VPFTKFKDAKIKFPKERKIKEEVRSINVEDIPFCEPYHKKFM